MSHIKISIIIPIYNVEKYLKNCLDSCFDQDIPSSEYEVIAVNDGSPDQCGIILSEYEKKYENIKVINKANGGLSTARNAGFDVANGDLIWFVDGDDAIEKNVLGFIVKKMLNNDIEAMTFGYHYLNEEGSILPQEKRILRNNSEYTGYELYRKAFIFPFSGAQFYIFRRIFLQKEGLLFFKGIYFEDILFTTLLYTRLNRCLYVEKKLYNYYIHKGSITNSNANIKKGSDFIFISEILYHEINNVKEQNNRFVIYSMIATIIKPVYIQYVSLTNNDCEILRSKFLKERYWLESIINGKKWKNILLYLFLVLRLKIKIH